VAENPGKGFDMAIYRVTYGSMTARYGPVFIDAADEYEAKRKFAKGAFSENEMGCITARECSLDDLRHAMAEREQNQDE
jgi:hypothetical protein